MPWYEGILSDRWLIRGSHKSRAVLDKMILTKLLRLYQLRCYHLIADLFYQLISEDLQDELYKLLHLTPEIIPGPRMSIVELSLGIDPKLEASI